MASRKDFRRLYVEAFGTTRQHDEWFVNEICRAADIRTLEVDGTTVSTLLAQPYDVSFYGHELRGRYLSCVTTATRERGRGYMSRLLQRTIAESASRGDAFAMLIPATRRLYSYYEKFGFASAFYVDEQRYTSEHKFAIAAGYTPTEPSYEMFAKLENSGCCVVKHSRSDFEHVLCDLQLDGGAAVAVAGPSGSQAMAFATVDDTATVRALPATDAVAAEAALGVLRAKIGERPMVVWGAPGCKVSGLRARGMIRIVNVAKVLETISATNPQIAMAIRVHDSIVESNNAVFRLSHGQCQVEPYGTNTKGVELNVRVDVLAMVLFSAPCVASAFDLPGCRPRMMLMLD